MTTLLVLWLPACAVFVLGVLVGRAVQRWAHPEPRPGDFDAGYQAALHALGWANGYGTGGAPRQARRDAWRRSWRYRSAP